MDMISALNCQFLTAGQIQALQAVDVNTFVDLINISSQVVCSTLNITDLEYSTILKQALSYAQPKPISLLQLATPKRLAPRSTGLAGFDKMLGGGLFPGDIIEIYGKTGTGKTQLCLQLTSQFCHFSKEPACVLYFDMKNDFNAKRLHQLCNKSVESLSRVQVFKEPNLDGLLTLLDDIKNQLYGGINGFYSRSRFLVVDSVPMLIYPAVDLEPYSWRFHQERLIERLAWLANHLNATVILVNHAVTTRPGPGAKNAGLSRSFQPTIKPAMGKYWFQKISTRIQLSKLKGYNSHFVANLEKTSRTSEGQKIKFLLTNEELLETV